MTELPAFVLDLRSTNGEALTSVDDGDGAQLSVHEWTSWLRIRSDVSGFVAPSISPDDDEMTGFVPPVFEDDGLAVLVHLRDHQDLAGEAVGLYHARLELRELEALHAAVANISWPDLPRPVGGDFNAPDLHLRYASGSLLIERGFNAGSGNFIEAIAPLWTLLSKLMTRTMRGASGTLEPKLALERDDEDPRRLGLRFSLCNRSIGPVGLTDPRVAAASGPPRLELKFGERVVDREWVSPSEWTLLDIPGLPDGAPESLILPARRRWEIELPWVAPKPGRYELRARWRDYGGPLEPLPHQTPFMPVPGQGPSFVGSGPYPIRGCCRAALRFEIPEEQSP